jgi:SLOG cluster2/TIR domain
MLEKQPLLVHFLFHPDSTDARGLAQQVHLQLNQESVVPRLRVPTMFCPTSEDGRPPKEVDFGLARRNVVVVFADDFMVIDKDWCRFVADTWEKCSGVDSRCLPFQLTEHAWPLDNRLRGVNFSHADQPLPADERVALVTRRIVVELCRFLRCLSLGDDASKAPVKLFLSHTKLDIDTDPKVAKLVIALLKGDQPIETWVDSGDIPTGSAFAKEIASGVQDSSLLVVLTDNYATRTWCQEEVMLAKEHDRPIAVIDCLSKYEVRSFPFLGNVPWIRWSGDPQAGIDALLKETLRTLVNLDELSRVQQPGDLLFSRPPELATLVGRTEGSTVLYPDPPLGLGETTRLARAKIHVTTPLQRLALTRPLKGKRIALSMSGSTDIKRFGLDTLHLNEAIVELSRYLLIAGATLAYGGNLGSDGYTQTLFELVRTYNSYSDEQAQADCIVNFRGWPLPRLGVAKKAELKAVCVTQELPRPVDIDTALHADFTESPVYFDAALSPLHRFAWARGMTDMRAFQADAARSKVAARVVVGGAFGPTLQPQENGPRKLVWYSGRIPGVLEEVVLSAQAGQPVFLLGAFGGAARLVIDLLRGIDRPEATWDYQKNAPHAAEMKELYIQRGLKWLDYPEMVAQLRAKGLAGLNPLLSAAEHERLCDSVDPLEMAALVLTGVGRLKSGGS